MQVGGKSGRECEWDWTGTGRVGLERPLGHGCHQLPIAIAGCPSASNLCLRRRLCRMRALLSFVCNPPSCTRTHTHTHPPSCSTTKHLVPRPPRTLSSARRSPRPPPRPPPHLTTSPRAAHTSRLDPLPSTRPLRSARIPAYPLLSKTPFGLTPSAILPRRPHKTHILDIDAHIHLQFHGW